MIKRYIKDSGPAKTGPKARIGRVSMAISILLSAFLFSPGVVQGQSITIAGDADQGDQGRWMKAKVEEFSKQTGINVRYIGRPLAPPAAGLQA
jgi:ABC-type glycerol-3-phosphate transport system substrate-binding protein